MVQISESAVALLDRTREEHGIPDDYGLRIFGEQDPQGGVQVHLTFTDSPDEGDEVVERSGTQVYVAPEVAAPLEDAVIDVAEAEGGSQLVIRPQQAEPGV